VLVGIMHATTNDAGVAGNQQHRSKDNEVFHFDLLSPLFSTHATKPLAAFWLSLCEFCPVKNHARFGSSAGNLFANGVAPIGIRFPVATNCPGRDDAD
jgi:hypothetical protein